MKREKRILTITTLLNLLVALIKLIAGLIFNFSSLIADSMHSFADFITDIISTFANKIGKKRANKKYPFGYGMIENISNLMIGIILFLLASYILIESFHTKEITMQPAIYLVLIGTIIMKTIIVMILHTNGKKLNSNILIISSKESLTDLVSSVIVLIVSLLLLAKDYFPILKYSDSIGSILISIIVYRLAFQIIWQNIKYLLGTTEENEELKQEIKNTLNKHKEIKNISCQLMKIGTYYNLRLTLKIDSKISFNRLFNLETKIKKELRNKFKTVRFVEIEASPIKIKD